MIMSKLLSVICSLWWILAKCIDQYISKRQQGVEKIDSRLEDIVQNMFNKCYADGESEQVDILFTDFLGDWNSFRSL